MSKLQETRTLNKYHSPADHIFSKKVTLKNKRHIETGDRGCFNYTPESKGTVRSPPSQPYLLRPRCNQSRIVHPRTFSGPLTKVQKSEALERFKTFLATGDLIKALQCGNETVDSALARDEVVRYVVQLGSFLMEKVVVSDHQAKSRYCLSESEAVLLETILDEMRIRKRNHLLWAPPEVSCISMMEFLIAIEEAKFMSENQINELIDQKLERMFSQLEEEMQEAYENDLKELYGSLRGILQQFSDHVIYRRNHNLLRTTAGSSNNKNGDSQHLWKKLKCYWDQHLSDPNESAQKSLQFSKSSFDSMDHLSGNSSSNASFKKKSFQSHELDPTEKVNFPNSMTKKLGFKKHFDISQHVDSGFSSGSVESVLKPISYNHKPSKGFQNKDITVDSGLSWFDNLGQVSVDTNISLDKKSSWIDASSKDWFDEIVANEVNHTSKYRRDKPSVIVSSTPVMNRNNNFRSIPFSPIERNPEDDIFKMPYSTLKSSCADSSSSSQTSFSLSFAKRKRCKKHLFSKKLFSQQNLTYNLNGKCVKKKANPFSGYVSEFSTNCTPTFIASGNTTKRNAANVGLKTNQQLESNESSLIKTTSKSSSLDRTRLDLFLLASYGVKEKDPVKRNPTQNEKVVIRRKFR